MEGRKGLAHSEPELVEGVRSLFPPLLPSLTAYSLSRKSQSRCAELSARELFAFAIPARRARFLNRDLNHQVTSILTGLAKYDDLNEISLARVVREGISCEDPG